MEDTFDPYHKWLGIPPKDQPPNHYRLLGVELLEADLDVIENAADQRMRHVRSFQNGPHQPHSQKLLNEITSAKICLLNPEQKAEYDAQFTAAADEEYALVAKPALVKSPSVNVDKNLATTAGAMAHRRSKIKNPVIEIAKIIVGGAVGLLIGIMILGFLREDWDMLGIAKAVRGSGGSEVKPPNDQPPPTTDPPKTDPEQNKKTEPGKVKPPTPPVVKLSALSGIVEAKPFVWKNGEQALDLGPPQDSFLVTSWFAGFFLGNGEWYTADVHDGHYRLHGSGVKPMGVTVTRVTTPYRAWFESEVKQYTWKKGSPRIQLIHQHDGFAVLSGVSGCLLGAEHSAEVYLDPADGYWYINGATNFDTKGQALVYRFKQPGKFRAEVKQIAWKPGDERQKLFACEEGICFVSAVSGAFKGLGENLNAMAEPDGYWHVWGFSKAGSTRGSFTSIRFNTPEMLAMAPSPPKLKMGVKDPPPMIEPMPMPPVEPMPEVDVKGPPPDEAALASLREKLKETIESATSNANTLLAAAAEKRPREERYVLFIAARDKAITDGESQTALRVIDKLSEKFEVNAFDLQTDALLKLRDNCTTALANRQLALAAIEHFDKAVAQGNKAVLMPLAELCVTAARKSEDAELARRATLKLIEARK